MTSLADAVAQIVADDRPVLCLDTCDFLDVVRGFTESNPKEANLFNARSFRQALDALTTSPELFQVVITFLVRQEWDQNVGEACRRVDDHLRTMGTRLEQVSEACDLGQVTIPEYPVRLESLPLASSLVATAEGLLERAMVIDREEACVARALGRVLDPLNPKRPSHKGAIKDSIHWEHYLELSCGLVAAGHSSARIFVSANKADFWADRVTPTIHPDLEVEASGSGLRFFGKLDDALRALGVP